MSAVNPGSIALLFLFNKQEIIYLEAMPIAAT